MMRIVLANIDYRAHLTDEGDQLQRGLEEVGWRLAGNGFPLPHQDVRQILDTYNPAAVFVSDARDFDPESPGSFRKDVGFSNLGWLGAQHGTYVVGVLKDAGSVREYQRRFLRDVIGANAVVTYYDPETVRDLNPWLREPAAPKLVRTYHSIDRNACHTLCEQVDRKRGVVSGALDPNVYPVRTRVAAAAGALGLDVIPHPGYHNRGNETAAYLRRIAAYRIHVATGSVYGFALRKIIESVAVGTTPVTNLPATDSLPEIDGALVRVSMDAGVEEIREAVDRAEREWRFDERRAYARKALDLYDYRTLGRRLTEAIEEVACTR